MFHLAARFHAFLNSILRPSDAARVRTLRQEVSRQLTALGLDNSSAQVRLAEVVAQRSVDPSMVPSVVPLVCEIFQDEGYFHLPEELEYPMTAELWEQYATLQRQRDILRDLDESMHRLTEALHAILPQLSVSDEPTLFYTPLYTQVPQFPDALERLLAIVSDDRLEDLFLRIHRQLTRNIAEIEPRHQRPTSRPTTTDPETLIDDYLGDTAFEHFYRQTIALPVSQETFFSHMHVVGGSGAGKTQWLSQLILHHLDQEDPPALVVVDSQGDLIRGLSHLAMFDPERGRLADRLILISPKDIHYPPSINIFDIDRGRLQHYDQVTREQVVAGVIQTFDYLFSGLIGADLTAKQTVFFRFVARLLLALPDSLGRNATILDMIDLMDDHEPYAAAIASLPPIERAFFERDFTANTFKQTKEQIRYRLNAILENPTLQRLFTSQTTKVDLFEELNRGSIILIDTAADFLKGASASFGRIFISLVLQATLERAAIPEHKRRPAFLIVDEAAEYFDSNIDDLLTEARKYKLGCVFAHQYLDQCTPSLRASLAANTSIKLAGGVSMSDAKALAPDLRTTAHFVLDQPRFHFACHIRNVTRAAFSLMIVPGTLARRERISDDAYRQLIERNRKRVHERPREKTSPAPSPQTPPPDRPEVDDPTAPGEW